MNDKTREEFESFYREKAKTLPLSLGNEPVRYAGGQYVNDFALFGWMVWQASRAAIEIDLPKDRPARGYGEQISSDMGFNEGVDYCRDAIEAAGLKVKP